MKPFKRTLTALILGFMGMSAMSLSAGETEKHQVMIQVDKTDDHDALIDLKVDGVAEKFSMPELKAGESRTITTESGKAVTVTKTDKGMTLDVDGKTIDLPMFGGNLGARIHRSLPLHEIAENNITISGVKLDDAQKQIIRDAFTAAGIVDKKITFNDKNFIFISTGENMEFGNEEHEFEWHSDSGEHSEMKFKVIIDDESNGAVKKEIIHIKKKKD